MINNSLKKLFPCENQGVTIRELVIVIRVEFLIDARPAFRFYAEGLMQNSSQLVG
jgi:hypothetical protein